jgi:hypothetical protein
MNVDSTPSGEERLFVMLDTPKNPRTGDDRPSVCIWLGKNADGKTTAGHGMLSRTPVRSPSVKTEFISATVPDGSKNSVIASSI